MPANQNNNVLDTNNLDDIPKDLEDIFKFLEHAKSEDEIPFKESPKDDLKVKNFKPKAPDSAGKSQATGILKPNFPTPSPRDYTQTEFPKNDHLDFYDMQEINMFRSPGSKHKWHSFDNILNRIYAILPFDKREKIEKDDLLKRRFESIIVTYLKDIRDELETRQRLSARQEDGGMEFDYDLIDRIFEILSNKDIAVTSINTDKKQKEADADIQKAENSVAKKGRRVNLIPSNLDLKKIYALQKEKGEPSVKPASKNGVSQDKLKTSQFQHQTANAAESNRPFQNTTYPREAPSTKSSQKIIDIKRPQTILKHSENKESGKLVSPVGELELLSLEDLRRAGNPLDFVNKVLEKVDNLSRDNYENRAKAIQLWKKSPLFKLYVKIGNESLNQKMSVEEYLKQNKEATIDEFNAIAELNRRLRF